MYNCRYESDNGHTFYFGYAYGTIFDLDPISQVDVDISTAQEYQQIGTIIEAETVGGVSREINGVFLDYTNTELVSDMLSAFVAGKQGKLYFNDNYYCECSVQKTPQIYLKNRKRSFSLMLYCAYPYWLYAKQSIYYSGGYTDCFEFPVCYDSHAFGVAESETYITCINDGMVEVPYKAIFTCSVSCEGYGIKNTSTGDILRFDDTLLSGETLSVYKEKGKLKIQKTVDGETVSAFDLLDNDSTFFSVPVGTSQIARIADSGLTGLKVVLYVRPVITGVIADD